MNSGKLRLLLIAEQCDPDGASVPLEGFRWYVALSRLAHVTLVTHERNRRALERAADLAAITFIPESSAGTRYFRLAARIATIRGQTNWPILHALSYPLYWEFERRVFRRFAHSVSRGAYDVVHAFSPVIPRYPVKIIEACRNTPFVLGPVNGGLAYPRAFRQTARREFNYFNFLRTFSRWIPGYAKTYRRADKILGGSTATSNMLRRMFSINDDRLELFHENGVPDEFFADRVPRKNCEALRLLFVGRLVPYKCADVVIAAMSRLPLAVQRRTSLTIVGDGPERERLEKLARRLGLAERVCLAGWVDYRRVAEFYRQADIFCFPSIREFGGAVVLEAMAAGLPCIVADYGGIAEYVTEETGFKIAPLSRTYLSRRMAQHIETIAGDETLRERMSHGAVERARTFTWSRKAQRMVSIYEDLVRKSRETRNFAHA